MVLLWHAWERPSLTPAQRASWGTGPGPLNPSRFPRHPHHQTAASEALRVIKEAKALEAAGCFSVVLECVPGVVAAAVTRELGIPTIGIGAGGGTSGQVGGARVCWAGWERSWLRGRCRC